MLQAPGYVQAYVPVEVHVSMLRNSAPSVPAVHSAHRTCCAPPGADPQILGEGSSDKLPNEECTSYGDPTILLWWLRMLNPESRVAVNPVSILRMVH